jgi:hypothetical protein
MPGELAVASRCQLGWSPRCLQCPQVDPALTELHAVVRVAEVLRYSGLKFEYWLSPGGHVREVARLSILLAVVLGFPVLMVLPLVTLLLVQVAGWTDLILKILLNAAVIAAAIIAAIVIGSAALKEFTKKRPPR